MKKRMNRKLLGYIALALVCVFAGTVIGLSQPAATAEEKVVLTSPFTEAINKVSDSVVGVNNYQIVNNNYGADDGYGYFPWSYFGYGNGYGYGNGRGQQESREVKYGSGSGVVIASEYVLTNYHVVENASSLKISIDDTEENLYDAEVVAYDADKDVAVLHVPGLPLAPVELGDSDELEVGDWVVCIGNAIGFTKTATAGIVSGLNREIPGDGKSVDKYGRASKVVNKMIQTDAAINSGNSGGGMFNTAGQLVGIPTLKYSGKLYSSMPSIESVSMCIPINEAKDVIEEGLNKKVSEPAANSESGKEETEPGNSAGGCLVGKPRMGVTVTTIQNTRGQLPNGAYIISVEENSPAQAAGLKPGDIMVEVNGTVISTVSEEIELVSQLKEGDQVAVKVFRPKVVEDAEKGRISTEGEYIDLTVTLAVVDQVAQ